jgi:hypothetical protein
MEEPGGASSVRRLGPSLARWVQPCPCLPSWPSSCFTLLLPPLFMPRLDLSLLRPCLFLHYFHLQLRITHLTNTPTTRSPLVLLYTHNASSYTLFFFKHCYPHQPISASSLTKTLTLSQPDTNNTVAPPSPPPPPSSQKMSTSSTNSWLRAQRKSDLVEVAETVGLKE